eukprot:4362239-Amphidinium_carterae.1
MSADANFQPFVIPTVTTAYRTETSKLAVEVLPYGWRKLPHITSLNFLLTYLEPSSLIAGFTT